MATLLIRADGFFNCDGTGKCGGNCWQNKEALNKCFHCDSCSSFKREELRIIDKRGETKLDKWF